jgi:hypothetical protein
MRSNTLSTGYRPSPRCLAATDFIFSSCYRKRFMVSAHNEPTEYDDGDAFFAAIGAAIIAWQSVEREMAHLFSHLLASRAGFAASAVFYHIKNNKTRVEMLDIAARISFGFSDREDLLAEWQSLSKSVINASRLRNQIAHSDVEDELTVKGLEYKLLPPSFDYSRLDPSNPEKHMRYRKAKTLSLEHINGVARDFNALSDALNKFAIKLSAITNPE